MPKIKIIAIFAALIALFAHSSSIAAKIIILPGAAKGAFIDAVSKKLFLAGHSIVMANYDDISSKLANESGSLLIVNDSRFFPINSLDSLKKFLQNNNGMLLVSGPAFSELLYSSGGKWFTQEKARAELANVSGNKLIDFSNGDIASWKRFSGTMSNKTGYRIELSSDPQGAPALQVSVPKLDDYDMVATPDIPEPFANGATCTVFWAKGVRDTGELEVEWHEKDGSRWMTVIKLEDTWQQYVIKPDDLKFWGGNSERGKPGDKFNPANAKSMMFGIASGITNTSTASGHSYWISDIRTVSDAFASVSFEQPQFESISPAYKTYATNADKLIRLATGKPLANDLSVLCPLPRSPGHGGSSIRPIRMMPVLSAIGSNGETKGYAAHILVNSVGKLKNSVWGIIGIEQKQLDSAPEKWADVAASMANRISSGVFLSNAGTMNFSYPAGSEIKCGAYILNNRPEAIDASVEFSILKGGSIVWSEVANVQVQTTVEAKPHKVESNLFNLPPGEYRAKTVLKTNGRQMDAITHDFRVCKAESFDESSVVSVKDGDFMLNGRQWTPVGINYWPRYSVGWENEGEGLNWLKPDVYDQDIIEADLKSIASLGINQLSIQYTDISQAPNVVDFLHRARKYGFKVMIYMHGLNPLDQNFESARKQIEAAGLANEPSFFSYDVGWEVIVGKESRRRNFDGEWNQWVIDHYGSIENACKNWGFTPPLNTNGMLSGATDEQLRNDGEWRRFVAANRRFWDDRISIGYAEVRGFIKSIDPHHLISARSGFGGMGTAKYVEYFPFDLMSGAMHLDFVSPEAYPAKDTKKDFIALGFATAYGRYASGGKPVFWAEYGMSVWPESPDRNQFVQESFYRNFYMMLDSTNASGSAAWWWPGGRRPGEGSDYGVINPDTSYRPSALLLRDFAKKSKSLRAKKQPDSFINIDRDKYVSGYSGVQAEHQEAFADAILAGKTPVIVTDGTGKDSANVSLIAIGDAPFDGTNPPKYLNSQFISVEIDGKKIYDWAEVKADKSAPMKLKVTLGNTGEAAWAPYSDSADGGVSLVISAGGKTQRIPVKLKVGFLDQITLEADIDSALVKPNSMLTMRLNAKNRADFGCVFRFTLKD